MKLKSQILKRMSRHTYPQNVFGKSILKRIRNREITTIVDAPCGNGETTYHIAKGKLNSEIFAYDLSENSILSAKNNFQLNNITFKEKDIFEAIGSHSGVDVFCVINSIFLLPNPQNIITDISKILKRKGKLFFIIPNINGVNFNKFIQRTPHNPNNFYLTPEKFIEFVIPFGFELINYEGVAFVSHYYRKEGLFLSVFIHFYLTLLSKLFKLFKIAKPNYFLIEFIRE